MYQWANREPLGVNLLLPRKYQIGMQKSSKELKFKIKSSALGVISMEIYPFNNT